MVPADSSHILLDAGLPGWLRAWMSAQEDLEAFLTPPRSPEFSRETQLLSRATLSRVQLGPSGFARGGDATVQVYSWGEGPTILFVHGWGGNAGNHYAAIEAVLQAGGRAVAFDAPGHGRSEGTFSCAPGFAWAIEGVAEHVGPLHGIVAHSLGGAATCIALRRGVQSRLAVLMASACWVAPVLTQYTEKYGYSPARTAAVLDLARQVFASDESSAADNARNLHDTQALLMHDPEDREMPYAHSAAIAAAWPGAKLLDTPKTGHRSILRSRSVVAAICQHVLSVQASGADV